MNESNETSMPIYTDSMYVYDSLILITCFVGVVSDVFIIINVWKSERLKSSSYLVLMCWAAIDALSLIFTPFNYHVYQVQKHHIFNNKTVHCYLFDAENITRIVCDLLLVVSLIQFLMDLNKKYLKIIITILIVLGVITWLTNSTLCYVDYNFHYIYLILLSINTYIFLSVIFMQINAYILAKENKSYRFRLNVVTIFIASWAISLVFLLLSDIDAISFFGFVDALMYLSSFFILLYAVYVDDYFKHDLLKMFGQMYGDSENGDAFVSFVKLNDEVAIDNEN